MRQTFNILNDNIKQSCIDHIQGLNPGDWVVTIKDKGEARSAAQLRLKWLWMGVLEKKFTGIGYGCTANQWNAYFKRLFIKEILISQDESYVEKFSFIRKKAVALKYALSYEDYMAAEYDLWDEIKTEWLHVNNMKIFMDKILDHCSTVLGVVLPIPDDLVWLYDGKESA